MLFTVQELRLRKIPFSLPLGPGLIDYAEPGLAQRASGHAEGEAELISEVTGEIQVRGRIEVRLAVECDRCLEEFEYPVESEFEASFLPAAAAPQVHDRAIDAAETNVGFYQEAGVELLDVLREQVLLELPVRRVCREGCRGLCPHCGQSLNAGPCACHEEHADERWAALRGLKVSRTVHH